MLIPSSSLSFHHNKSQDMILHALRELNKHLEESDCAASHPYATSFLGIMDTHLVTNLKGLVRAAQNFHASASSTASSIRGGQQSQRELTPSNYSSAQTVVMPKMTSFKKRQIEMFLTKNRRQVPAGSNSLSKENTYMPSITPCTDSPEVVEPEPQGDFEVNLDDLFSKGLSQMAQKTLLKLNLPEAEKTLEHALKRHRITDSDDPHHRRLRTQLALCILLQGNIQRAEDLILDMVEFRVNSDSIASQLLYALALAQTHECNFMATIGICERLWQSFKGSDQPTAIKEYDIYRLLAISHRESGEECLSQALEEVYPDLDLQTPLPTVGHFIANCEELLVELFGLGKAVRVSTLLVHRIKQLPIFRSITPLQMKLARRSDRQDDSTMGVSDSKAAFEDKAYVGARDYPTQRNHSAR
jgi:tetratricopeptide (TPR) repeat protein